LWLSTPPYGSKIFYNVFSEKFPRYIISSHLQRLYKKGFIKKIKNKNRLFFKLTTQPHQIIFNELIKTKVDRSKKRWDGLWRLVIYDIPERFKYRRDTLRDFLKELGFGKVQESCWVSPYDFSSLLYEFCKFHKILKYICIYEGKFFAGKNIDLLVEEIWHLRDLNRKYEEFINLCKKEIEVIEIEELNSKECYERYYKVYKIYKNLVEDDPFLPDRFLKKNLREKAYTFFEKLSSLAAKELVILMKKEK
jgi:phenylacetic acid degradation operon negative regulatory protein